MLLTAVFASLSGGYALYTVFDNAYYAAGFGILWGLMIFSLDRYLVASMKKIWRKNPSGRVIEEEDIEETEYIIEEAEEDVFEEDQQEGIRYIESPRREFFQAFPRILLALVIAVVISKPLEMKIFEKEINQILEVEKNALKLANQEQVGSLYNTELSRLRREIERLQNQITDKQVETNALYQSYIAEAEGSGGTMRIGKGPIYQEKRAKHDQSFAELQELKATNQVLIANLQSEIEQIEAVYKQDVAAAEPVIENFDGLQARIEAIVKMENPWPSVFIMLLFLAIETAPIVSKLLSPVGHYDREILALEHRKWQQTQAIIEKREIYLTELQGDEGLEGYKEYSIWEHDFVDLDEIAYSNDENKLRRYNARKARERRQLEKEQREEAEREQRAIALQEKFEREQAERESRALAEEERLERELAERERRELAEADRLEREEQERLAESEEDSYDDTEDLNSGDDGEEPETRQ